MSKLTSQQAINKIQQLQQAYAQQEINQKEFIQAFRKVIKESVENSSDESLGLYAAVTTSDVVQKAYEAVTGEPLMITVTDHDGQNEPLVILGVDEAVLHKLVVYYQSGEIEFSAFKAGFEKVITYVHEQSGQYGLAVLNESDIMLQLEQGIAQSASEESWFEINSYPDGLYFMFDKDGEFVTDLHPEAISDDVLAAHQLEYATINVNDIESLSPAIASDETPPFDINRINNELKNATKPTIEQTTEAALKESLKLAIENLPSEKLDVLTKATSKIGDFKSYTDLVAASIIIASIVKITEDALKEQGIDPNTVSIQETFTALEALGYEVNASAIADHVASVAQEAVAETMIKEALISTGVGAPVVIGYDVYQGYSTTRGALKIAEEAFPEYEEIAELNDQLDAFEEQHAPGLIGSAVAGPLGGLVAEAGYNKYKEITENEVGVVDENKIAYGAELIELTAALCDVSYSPPENKFDQLDKYGETIPEGLQFIQSSRDFGDDSGFYAETYYDPLNHDVIVVYRGTDLDPATIGEAVLDAGMLGIPGLLIDDPDNNGVGDLIADVKLGLGINGTQDQQAVQYLQHIIKEVEATLNEKGADLSKVNFVVTGHSLGDHLAQHAVANVANDYPELRFDVIGFNGPGIGNDDVDKVRDNANVTYLSVNEKHDVVAKAGLEQISDHQLIVDTGIAIDITPESPGWHNYLTVVAPVIKNMLDTEKLSREIAEELINAASAHSIENLYQFIKNNPQEIEDLIADQGLQGNDFEFEFDKEQLEAQQLEQLEQINAQTQDVLKEIQETITNAASHVREDVEAVNHLESEDYDIREPEFGPDSNRQVSAINHLEHGDIDTSFIDDWYEEVRNTLQVADAGSADDAESMVNAVHFEDLSEGTLRHADIPVQSVSEKGFTVEELTQKLQDEYGIRVSDHPDCSDGFDNFLLSPVVWTADKLQLIYDAVTSLDANADFLKNALDGDTIWLSDGIESVDGKENPGGLTIKHEHGSEIIMDANFRVAANYDYPSAKEQMAGTAEHKAFVESNFKGYFIHESVHSFVGTALGDKVLTA